MVIVNSTPTNSTSGSFLWTVPNSPTNQARIRASVVGSPSIQSSSNVNFTISPFVVLTSPNGGQNWAACTNQTITWSRGGTTNTWRLEYSTDAGQSWQLINGNLSTSSATSLSFSWAVPNLPTSQALIRISDANDTTKRDTSNAVFTIIRDQSLVVNAPNGGETWQGGTNRTVSWASQNVSSTLEMAYSTDLGQNWTLISTISSFNNQYTWGVPNAPGSNNLFRIRDWNNVCKQDVSDAPFTITAANQSLTILNPTTNVSWYAGQIQTISWTNQFIPANSFVRLEYSIDGGANWLTIVNAAPAGTSSGAYNWTIPNTPTTQARIRISLVGNSAIQVVSPVNFTLLPFIVLTSPTGNLTWPGCETRSITWARGGTSNFFNLDYSLDGGATWLPIAANVSFGSSTNLNYSWVVNNAPTTGLRIRVSDAFDLTKSDSSRTNNTITRNQSIFINTPNGGEQWKGNTIQQISWAANNVSGTLELSYSTDAGLSWNLINSTSSINNTFNWTIPNAPSNQALVRVRDWNNACKADTSDAVFSMLPPDPSINLTSFNNGLTVYAGQVQNISWSNQFLTNNNIRIEYSMDNGQSWTTIVNATPTNNTSGGFNWTVPNTPTRFALIRVSMVGNTSVQSVSTIPFIIQPFVVLSTPNGGENWSACTNRTISWARGGSSNQWRIEYSTDGGANWILITNNHFGVSGVNQNYTWSVPNVPTASARIRVSDALDLSKSDTSDGDFSILQDQSIIVNSPNGGEVWTAGENRLITWAYSGAATTLSLQYSIDNGQTWSFVTSISSSVSQFNWSVPNTVTTGAMIRVIDANNTCRNDVSDAIFTILPPVPSITLTSPNGGNNLFSGSIHTITWTSQFIPSSFVRLEYSIDNGFSWLSIINATANSGSYNWTVPDNITTTQALVRIADFSNTAILDVSNSVFSISPAIRIISPNGGEQLFGCAQTTISWSRGGTSNNFRLEYSVDNGQSWIFITNVTSTSSTPSFTWTLPAVGSPTYRVRILDQSNNARVDVSDTTFTVFAPIRLIDPNTGGQWIAGVPRLITWEDTLTTKNYNLDYSLNGGATWTNIVVNQQILNGQYLWNVPNVSSVSALIRITEFGSTCKRDVSEFPFIITSANNTLNLTFPNGGNEFESCQVMPISWTSQNMTGTVRIEVSYNLGSNWTVIENAVPVLNGIYNWTIPNVGSSLFLVRVKSNDFPLIEDISNAVNTIKIPNAQAGIDRFICLGDSIQIGGGGVGSSSWSPMAGLSSSNAAFPWASPNTTTTYNLTVTNSFGCSATDQVVVTVSPKPNLSITGDTVICSGNTTQLEATGALAYLWSPTTGVNNPNLAAPRFNPTTTTQYRVIGSNNGCSDTAFVRVLVNPSPSTPQITPLGSTTFCQGDSVFLSSSATSGNQWYRNGVPLTGETGGILNVKTGGSYYVRVNNGSCSLNSAVLLVVVNSRPPVPTITSTGSLQFCTGGSVTLTSSSATGNTWLRNNLVITGATNPTFVASTAGTYTVRISNGQCTATSLGASVVVNPPIPTPSVSGSGPLIFCNNDSVTLTASDVTGIWRWFKNGTLLPNDSTRTLVVKTGGSYTVRVERLGCVATSVAVTVTVNPLPGIPTISPSGPLSFCQGDSVTLNSGLNSNIQWLLNGSVINGATLPNLVVKNSGSYAVRQTQTGCSATSTPSIVTVNSLPAIPSLTPGFDQTLCTGQSVTLRASGIFNQYQWQNNQTDIIGQTTDSLTVTATGTYRLIVRNAAGCSRNSNSVTLTFQPLPAVPNIVANGPLSFCTGGSVRLSTGGIPVQWLRNGQPIPGTSDTLIANTSGTYTARNQSPTGCFSEGTPVLVQVNPIPASPVLTPAGNMSICDGQSVIARATVAPGTIQWLRNGSLVSGANADSLLINQAGSYQVRLTSPLGCTSNSGLTTITVNPNPPVPTIQALGALSFCQGGKVTLKSNVSSGSISWWKDGVILPTSSADSLVVSNGGNYQVKVTQTNGCSSESLSSVVIVNPLPASPVVTITGNLAICQGDSVLLRSSYVQGNQWLLNNQTMNGKTTDSLWVLTSGNFQVRYTDVNGCSSESGTTAIQVSSYPIATVINAVGNTTFCSGTGVGLKANFVSGDPQWMFNGSPINGANTDSLFASQAGVYSLVLSRSGLCPTPSANQITTQILPTPAIPQVVTSGALSFCQGDSVMLSGTGLVNYQWLKDGLPIPWSTDTFFVVRQTGWYQLSTTNGICDRKSDSIRVEVFPIPTTPQISANRPLTFCEGDSVLLSATQFGTSIRWYKNSQLIIGQTSDSLWVNSSGIYSMESINGGRCVSASNAITVTVNPLPAQPTVQFVGSTVLCQGDSLTLSTTAAGNVQWLLNGVAILGAQSTVWQAKTPGIYTVESSNSFGCSLLSNSVAITVNPIPAVPTLNRTGTISICQNERLVFRTTSSDTLKWFQNGLLIATGTDSLVITTSGLYQVEAVNASGCNRWSDTVRVLVNPLPVVPNITRSGNLQFCQGSQVVFRLNNVAGFNLQWFKDGQLMSGQTADSLVVTSSGIYQLRVENVAGCQSLANADTVIVNALPPVPITTPSGAISLCQGQSVLLTTSAASGLQWWKDGQPIASQTTDSLRVNASGQYAVSATNAFNCSSTSSIVSIIISPLPAIPSITPTGSTTFCSGNQVVLRSSVNTGNQWLLNGNPISGQTNDSLVVTSTGNYQVQVSNASNCVSTSTSLAVTVNPTPPIAQIGANGPTTFCQGGQVVLSSSITQNAVWVLNGQTFAPVSGSFIVVSSGSWAVRVAGANGCFSTSLPTIVTVNPIPIKPVISRVADTLYSSAASGNQWWLVGAGPVNGANQARLVPTQTGSYTVQVQLNGCTSSNADTVNFFFTTVEEQALDWPLSLFPNPTSDVLNLQLTLPEAMSLDASILDARGRLIRRWEILGIGEGHQQVKVNVEGLSDGIYYMRLVNPTDSKAKSLKFIIRK